MRKKGHAFGLTFMALSTIALIAAALGTSEWTVGKIKRNETLDADCVVTRKLGLFQLTDTREGCTNNDGNSFYVYCVCVVQFSHAVQYAVIAFCGVSIFCSLITMAVSAYNVCGNPYETYLSSIGLLCYNIAGLIASLVAVILYTVLLYTELAQPLLKSKPTECVSTEIDCESSSTVYGDNGYFIDKDAYFGYSFFLLVVSIVTYLIGICLALLSERDTMKRIRNFISPKKEQETNDQKMKDIMIY